MRAKSSTTRISSWLLVLQMWLWVGYPDARGATSEHAPKASVVAATTERGADDARPVIPAAMGELGTLDPARGMPGRWQRELDRRTQWLRSHSRRDVAAIVGLLGLLPELGHEIPDEKLQRFCAQVANDVRRHPLVRSHANYLLAVLREQQGDIEGARKQLEQEGYLLDWEIIGPFEHPEGAGVGAAHPPQTEAYAAEQVFEGKISGELVGWRPVEYQQNPQAALIAFDELLHPNENAIAYAASWVHVEHATSAVLHLGSGGEFAVFVNGVAAGTGGADRVPHPLQDALSIALRPGWNRLLLAVAVDDGPWGFYARVSAPSGAALDRVRFAMGHPDVTSSAAAPAKDTSKQARRTASSTSARDRVSPTFSAVRNELEREAASGAGEALTALAEYYRWTHPFAAEDSTPSRTARAADAAVRTGRSAWLAAALEADDNESRHLLELARERSRAEGVKSRGLFAHVSLQLAWRADALGLAHARHVYLAEARNAAPDDALVELAWIEDLEADGYAVVAWRWTEDLARRYPESVTVLRWRVDRELELGRLHEALDLLAAHSRAHGLAEPERQRYVALLLQLGNVDGALEQATAATLRAPGRPRFHAELGRLLQAKADDEAAVTAFGRALALAPQDAQLHAELGRLLLQLERDEQAAESLRRSLALKPQQPDVRDLLATLESGDDDGLFARYAVDLETVARRKSPVDWKGRDAGILHHRVVVRVLQNGLTERLDHRIIRVLDERGVRRQATHGMDYDPAEAAVEVRRARVRRKDGSIDDIGTVGTLALTRAGYRMYYDQRLKQVRFAGLQAGDTIEVAFLRRDYAARNKFDDYFGDLVAVQGLEPRLHFEYVLEAPASKTIYFNREVDRKVRGRTAVYRYVRADVPGIQPEANMPGFTEVAEVLQASTYASWDDVGRWYWNLVREQLVVDDGIREAVRNTLAGLRDRSDRRAQVDRIYEYVVRNTRYVGLEFGIHGFKPYRTTDVHARRFGDCKDKASLLKVMLEEAGIEAWLVLVRTHDQGTVQARPASLNVFNHAIAYVPEFDLYLDGTAEWSGPSELPANDQGATALLVRDGDGAELRTLPVHPATNNVRIIRQVVQLAADGAAQIQQVVEVQGADASAMRVAFASDEERRERFAELWGKVYPGVAVEGLEATGMNDILQPPRMSAKLLVPHWAQVSGEKLRFNVMGRESSLVQSTASQTKRRYPLMLDVPYRERHEIEVRLPPGTKFARMPSNASLETPAGTFRLEIRGEADRAFVRTDLQLGQREISPGDYASFRAFLSEVDARLEQTFEVERSQ